MSINLKKANHYKKVEIASVVYMQGDDFYQLMTELNPEYNLDHNDDSSDEDKINYMLEWYQDEDLKYMSNWYAAENLNTPFLGKIIKINGYKGYFLYSINRRLDYIGLSKILSLK